MKIWILSEIVDSPSITKLCREATSRGHDITLVNPLNLSLLISSTSENNILFNKKVFGNLPDVVLTRIGSSATQFSLFVLKQFSSIDIPTFNKPEALEVSRNKIRCFQSLFTRNISLPPTILLSPKCSDVIDAAVTLIPGPPWILKRPESYKGIGVMKIDSFESLKSVVDTLHNMGSLIILQKFIEEAKGSDIRVIVVGGKVVAAMIRNSNDTDFRANLHRGGTAIAYTPTAEVEKLALAASSALQLDIAGVDIMETSDGPVVIEVNGSPGLEGIEAATNINVARDIVEFLEIQASTCHH